MRINTILAAIVVILAAALVIVYASTDARVKELEAQLSLMDGNLKQFAVPMDNLRQDIAAIYVELDTIAMREQGGGRPRFASNQNSKRQYDSFSAPAMPMPAPQSYPTGAVHYGNLSNLDDTTVIDSMGERRQRTTFAELVDEED